MRFLKSKITFSISILVLIGGIIWTLNSNFQIEPILISIGALGEILCYIFIKESNEILENQSQIMNEQFVNVNVSVGGNVLEDQRKDENDKKIDLDRESIILTMQSKTNILFIDDDKNFNVVKILKDSNWKKVKTVVDIKSLDLQIVKDANILFIDINGVGKLLNLEFEGLDLALMLKQRYPEKKIIIYSAIRNNNSFHQAWDLCDFRLEKNALPYQFQNLVEEYSIQMYSKGK